LIGAAWGRLVGIGMSSLFPDAGLGKVRIDN